jgi:hypothetical protein
MPQSGLHQMRDDRRGRAAELERTTAYGEPDRRTVAMRRGVSQTFAGGPRAQCLPIVARRCVSSPIAATAAHIPRMARSAFKSSGFRLGQPSTPITLRAWLHFEVLSSIEVRGVPDALSVTVARSVHSGQTTRSMRGSTIESFSRVFSDKTYIVAWIRGKRTKITESTLKIFLRLRQ